MQECLIISFKKEDKETKYSLEDLYQELFHWLHYQVKKWCTGKSNAIVLDFIFESTGDGWVEENGIYISFRNAGGMCEMSQNTALHWFTLSYHLLHPQLDVLVKKMGYSLASLDVNVEDLLAKTIHHPITKVKGKYYNIYTNTEEELELNGDDEAFDLSTLTQTVVNKLKKQFNEKKCQCSLCSKLAKGKYKLIDLEALKVKEAQKTEYTTISSAIRNPRSARTLYIDNSSITELPPEIGQLQYLEKFVFYNNHWIKCIPKEIGALKRLKALSLTDNRGLEILPVEVFNCSNLEELDICSTEIGSLPPEIKQLTRLKDLKLQPSDFVSSIRVPKEIGTLKNLEYLSLSHVENEIPTTIYDCTQLKNLELDSCKINSLPKEIGNLKELNQLSLALCELSELPSSMSELTKLEYLNLSRNPIPTNELEKIDFSRFEKMIGLTLSDTPITVVPSSLYQLKNLEELYLGDTNIEEIDANIQQLSKLERLNLGGTKIKTLPASFGQLKKLNDLDLSETQLKELPVCIKELTSLRCLSLIKLHLEELPEWLNELPNLEYLNLRYCPNAKQLAKSLKGKNRFNIQVE